MTTVMWFKKDLRVQDNEALSIASQRGPTIGLYIVEPEWIRSYEFDLSHWQFLKESLWALESSLKRFNIPLIIKLGEASQVFYELYKKMNYKTVLSHEETGVYWTYQRDKKIKKLFKEYNIKWVECRQHGVIRGPVNRDQWAQKRKLFLNQKTDFTIHQQQPSQVNVTSEVLAEIEQKLNLSKTLKAIQKGGEIEAQKTLQSFLSTRGESYLEDISKPQKAEYSNSRISPYLAFGNLSIKRVHKELALRRSSDMSGGWKKSLWAFESRLWWRCHFMQKLETEPEIEFQNVNRAFDGLRESEFNNDYFEAWCKGQTGFPLIDAVMRCLLQTGWINFRMRAMLVSFASYQLWLHWQKPAQFLAKHFLDFEPGIHYSQIQMQSGVTGINAIRIYSPQKQVLDHDVDGEFIKRFCPELAEIPEIYLAEPHLTPPLIQMEARCRIGEDYPWPIVDAKAAYQQARDRIYAAKKNLNVKSASRAVYQKHGSREGRFFPKQNRQS